ncbi:class I SAM-dependent methyltransferase [Quadrisphaera sp. INWT6]|nr:class I SAM-dependent methyltransferase [Quadrisphaera sp. INWT6]
MLVDDPVQPWVQAVHAAVSAHNGAAASTAASTAASILDAGCGTGRHAAALVDLGYQVSLLDAAPQLLAIASGRCPGAPVRCEDLTTLRPPPLYDAWPAAAS